MAKTTLKVVEKKTSPINQNISFDEVNEIERRLACAASLLNLLSIVSDTWETMPADLDVLCFRAMEDIEWCRDLLFPDISGQAIG